MEQAPKWLPCVWPMSAPQREVGAEPGLPAKLPFILGEGGGRGAATGVRLVGFTCLRLSGRPKAVLYLEQGDVQVRQ